MPLTVTRVPETLADTITATLRKMRYAHQVGAHDMAVIYEKRLNELLDRIPR